MHPYRFYVPDLRTQAGLGDLITLPEDQAHHARSVLRLKAGPAAGGGREKPGGSDAERIHLFDGQGSWTGGNVQDVAKSAVRVRITQPVTIDPPIQPSLTLATAAPKGDRADLLIEQASQLNATAVQWLECDRSVVKPREGGQKIEKWRRLAIEAAKQCGRNHVLRVLEPVSLQELLRKSVFASQAQSLEHSPPRILWLDPWEGDAKEGVYEKGDAARDSGEMVALIGPEGGWSDTESVLLQKLVAEGHLTRVRLTRTVLRVETACAAIAAILMSGR